MITFKKYLTELKAVVRDGTPKRPYYFKRNDKNDILDANIQHRELSKKIPSLNDGEPRHIKEYKNSSEINSKLRNSARKLEDKDDIEHVKYLDAVTSHKTDKDMHVYRGFKNNFQIHNLHPGHIIHDKGYTGTSLEYNVARGEGLSILNKSKIKNIVKNKKIYAKIHIPAGTKGHYLDNQDAIENQKHPHTWEKEFLLHRGTHFKVLGHYYDPKIRDHVVHMTVHHQEDHNGD